MGIKITGVSVPFGGVSWEYTEPEKKYIQDLFFYLESKRVLTNPMDMEIKAWCEQSAIEIRNTLDSVLSKADYHQDTINCIRSMMNACNVFLDDMRKVDITGIIYKNNHGDWEHSGYSAAMKKFRKVFRDNIQFLSSAYGLEFPKEIPEEY